MEGNDHVRRAEGVQPGSSPASKPPARQASSKRMSLADMRARLHRFDVLFNVSRRGWQKETLEDVFSALVDITSTELNCERTSFFLNDPHTGELFSRAAQGSFRSEIRFPNTVGIDGAVFHSGIAAVIEDAYADPRFNATIDRELGFTTRNILSVPLRAPDGAILGVAQCLNKIGGTFGPA